MAFDRRGQERRFPRTLGFIQFDEDVAGKVLNVSEGGLGFETSSPMHCNGPTYFWFSLDLCDRIAAMAELVWTDDTKTTGGLKFIDLSEKASGRINDWITANSGAEKREVQPIPVGATRSSTSGEHSDRGLQTPAFEVSEEPKPGVDSGFAAQTAHAPFRTVRFVPLERHQSTVRRELIRGALLGALLSSVVTMAAMKFSLAHKQEAPPQRGSKQEAGINIQAQASMPGHLSTSYPTRSADPDKRKPLEPSSYPPDIPQKSALMEQHAQPRKFSSWSQPGAVSAQVQSGVAKSSKKITTTPEQLWSAVQSGNTRAAVALADLYIRGDGVKANCDQARVLLLFASEKGNVEAIQKLQQMNRTECPAP